MDRLPLPPVVVSSREYGERLTDVGFWRPYVRAVLARHRLPDPGGIEAGFAGTYPTFLVGGTVVKLFGYFPSWRSDHDAELAAQRVLADRSGVPVPGLLAAGQLYDRADGWPYLVTERVPGCAWRVAALRLPQRFHVAEQLGAAVRLVHELPPPATGPLTRDWLRDHGGTGCAERHRAWGSLPEHLIAQIDGYLADSMVPGPEPERRLVHADLTADHVFVRSGRLAGIIDWGDAMVTDPHYELGPLQLDPFRADPRVLRAFLTGYGWPVAADFPRHAMSAALRHQFDLFAGVRDRLRLARHRTLDDLATALWGVPAGRR